MNRNPITLFAKGLAIGAANVIPGVSGGTIALITGIYERLVLALKNVDFKSIQLLLHGHIRDFMKRIDGGFLFWLLLGTTAGILGLARLFEWLLEVREVPTFAFFFGLISVSVFYVGRHVKRWNMRTALLCLLGTIAAIWVSALVPAEENSNPFYIGLCGVIAVCSMILPGLSGSFVLILMGNYTLVLRGINSMDLSVLLPMALGCGLGLLGFAQFLGWLFKRYPEGTLATMTGFVLGSLTLIWPWKTTLTQSQWIDGELEVWVVGYEHYFPNIADPGTGFALVSMAVGAAVIIVVEQLAGIRTDRTSVDAG